MSQTQRDLILAGVDGSKHSADALALADVLASLVGGEPTPIHVAERSAARGLQRVAEQHDAALIVLGASQRSRLARVLLGGTAERLMSDASSAVGVAPAGYADAERSVETLGCAFDGSPESRAALRWTAELAKRSGRSVRILSVHQPVVTAYPAFRPVPMVAEDEAMRAHLARELEAAVLDLRRMGVAVEGSLLTGNAAAVLEEQSSEVDLLVCGSRGYGPHRAVLLGSVSGALVRRAACPVVVLPHGAEVAGLASPAAAAS